MAYTGQPFPGRVLSGPRRLRDYRLGEMTWSEAFSQATDVELKAVSDAIQWGKNQLIDAFAPGVVLSPDEVNTIKAQTNAAIVQAAGGNAALAARAQAQASGEIDAAVASGGSSLTNFLANNWPWLVLAGAAGFYIVRDL